MKRSLTDAAVSLPKVAKVYDHSYDNRFHQLSSSSSSSTLSSSHQQNCHQLTTVSTGIGYLDHMLEQLHSHAQISVQYRHDDNPILDDPNRNASLNQIDLLTHVGTTLGTALRNELLSVLQQQQQQQQKEEVGRPILSSTFVCPLDEALTMCQLQCTTTPSLEKGELRMYNLAPYGIFPQSGRNYIGRLETVAIRSFWMSLAHESGLIISLNKIRGNNAHHIVESSFKAFSRALRNLLDGVDTTVSNTKKGTVDNNNNNQREEKVQFQLDRLYGPDSDNAQISRSLCRKGSVTRNTKETSITAHLQLDGGITGVTIDTGIHTLDRFLTDLANMANISLQVSCKGDLWIDEHHTAEDVAIAIGQVLTQALGTKAGLNRMWCATQIHNQSSVAVTMDLSNRPCLTHNLTCLLEQAQTDKVGDLSLEMWEHVLDSLVVNAKMTVHIVHETKLDTINNNNHRINNTYLEDIIAATAKAFGEALKYCAMVDGRRAGATASSKGTLSV